MPPGRKPNTSPVIRIRGGSASAIQGEVPQKVLSEMEKRRKRK